MLQTVRQPGDFTPSLDPSRHISMLALSSTVARLSSGLLSDYMSSPNRAASNLPNPIIPNPFFIPRLRSIPNIIRTDSMATRMVFDWHNSCWNWIRRDIHSCTNCCQRCLGNWRIRKKLGNSHFHPRYPTPAMELIIALGAIIFGLLYARVYDVHSPPPPATCHGRECWQDTILAAAWAGLLATILLGSIWWWSWRKRGWTV